MKGPATTIVVVGAGYVDLVTGAYLAELGHQVVCVEVDPRRLAVLEGDGVPIHEPGLVELVVRNRAAGRLAFTDDHASALRDAAFALVAVTTPPRDDGRADTSFVFAAVRSILLHAAPHATIVTKSTVPAGTGDDIAALVAAAGRSDLEVVSNPEFLREGSAIRDFMAPDRIVVGAANPAVGRVVAGLYAALDAPAVVTSRRSAELAKYAANAFLATRVSLMNEVATLCEAAGADVEEVARIVGLDRRIGPAFLRAGLGWGGSCFPKDVRALAATAADHGTRLAILRAVLDANARQRERVVRRLLGMVEGTPNATVAVLGLAFKPDTDDVREAPALEIIGRLLEAGIRVRAHDPVAMANARRVLPGVGYGRDAYDAARDSDALLATEWRDYLDLDWWAMRDVMRGRAVLDGRNVLDGEALASLGFTYVPVGRARRSPSVLPFDPGEPRRNGKTDLDLELDLETTVEIAAGDD